MTRTLASLPFMVLLFILPFPHTVALRLVCLAAAFFIALIFWRQLAPPSFPCKWAIALWVAVVVASLAYAVDPAYSLAEIKNEIGYSLLAFAAFFAWCRDEQRLRLGCISVSASFVVISYSALLDYVVTGGWGLNAYYGGVGAVGSYLIIIGPVLALVAALFWSRRAGKWLVLSVVLFVAIALLTEQRTFWLAFALQMIIGGVWFRRISASAAGPVRWSLMVLLLFVLFGGGLYYSEQLRTGNDSEHPLAMTKDLRPHFWKAVSVRILEHPMTGAGFGRRAMIKAYPDLIPPGDNSLWHAHNLVLNYGISAGIPGMIAVIILFAALARRFWQLAISTEEKVRLAGLAGVAMVVGVFARNMTNDYFVRDEALLFWSLAGMLFGYALRRVSVSEEGQSDVQQT